MRVRKLERIKYKVLIALLFVSSFGYSQNFVQLGWVGCTVGDSCDDGDIDTYDDKLNQYCECEGLEYGAMYQILSDSRGNYRAAESENDWFPITTDEYDDIIASPLAASVFDNTNETFKALSWPGSSGQTMFPDPAQATAAGYICAFCVRTSPRSTGVAGYVKLKTSGTSNLTGHTDRTGELISLPTTGEKCYASRGATVSYINHYISVYYSTNVNRQLVEPSGYFRGGDVPNPNIPFGDQNYLKVAAFINSQTE